MQEVMCMKAMLEIDPKLMKRAREMTGVTEKSALVRLGLQWLVACESAKKLALFGGMEPGLRPVPRRRVVS